MVAPETVAVEGLLIGWPEIQLWGLLPHLEGVLVMQRELGLLSIAKPGDGNMVFTDLDQSTVETDQLLWPDLRPELGARPSIGEALSLAERVEVEALLQEFSEVFEENLPRGGANVEPLRVNRDSSMLYASSYCNSILCNAQQVCIVASMTSSLRNIIGSFRIIHLFFNSA
jgi:hypothetical protein